MNQKLHSKESVAVWDWSVRVFHWSLPLLLFALWFTRLETEKHMIFAQLLMGVLIYRLLWGFIGTPYARFTHFIYGPRSIGCYLLRFFQKDKPLYLSHNPLGGIMVLVLMGAVTFQLITGLFIDDWIYPGPLNDLVARSTADWMGRWHHRFFDVLLVLVGLHVTAILLYKIKGEGLLLAMLSGKKSLTPGQQAADLRADAKNLGFPWVRFGIAAALALVTVLWVFHWR